MAMRRSFISCAAIGKQIHMIKVKGGEEKLTCCGDELFNPCEETYAKTVNSFFMKHSASMGKLTNTSHIRSIIPR